MASSGFYSQRSPMVEATECDISDKDKNVGYIDEKYH